MDLSIDKINLDDYVIDVEEFMEDYIIQSGRGQMKNTPQGIKIYKRPFPMGEEAKRRFIKLIAAFNQGLVLADNIFLGKEKNGYWLYIVEPCFLNWDDKFLQLKHVLKMELSYSKKQKIFQNLVQTVKSLHALGQPHLEICPGNIWIENSEHVYLRPFSIAPIDYLQEIRSQDESPPPKVVKKHQRSKLWYVAPEQFFMKENTQQNTQQQQQQQQNTEIDYLSDMWSLGCVYFELFISLSPLFESVDNYERILKYFVVLGQPLREEVYYLEESIYQEIVQFCIQQQQQKEPLLHKLIESISKNEQNILMSLLQFNPFRRPTTDILLNFGFFQKKLNESPFLKNSQKNQKNHESSVKSISKWWNSDTMTSPKTEISLANALKSQQKINANNFASISFRKTKHFPIDNQLNNDDFELQRISPLKDHYDSHSKNYVHYSSRNISTTPKNYSIPGNQYQYKDKYQENNISLKNNLQDNLNKNQKYCLNVSIHQFINKTQMLKLGYSVAARIDLNINKTTITLNTSFKEVEFDQNPEEVIQSNNPIQVMLFCKRETSKSQYFNISDIKLIGFSSIDISLLQITQKSTNKNQQMKAPQNLIAGCYQVFSRINQTEYLGNLQLELNLKKKIEKNSSVKFNQQNQNSKQQLKFIQSYSSSASSCSSSNSSAHNGLELDFLPKKENTQIKKQLKLQKNISPFDIINQNLDELNAEISQISRKRATNTFNTNKFSQGSGGFAQTMKKLRKILFIESEDEFNNDN